MRAGPPSQNFVRHEFLHHYCWNYPARGKANNSFSGQGLEVKEKTTAPVGKNWRWTRRQQLQLKKTGVEGEEVNSFRFGGEGEKKKKKLCKIHVAIKIIRQERGEGEVHVRVKESLCNLQPRRSTQQRGDSPSPQIKVFFCLPSFAQRPPPITSLPRPPECCKLSQEAEKLTNRQTQTDTPQQLTRRRNYLACLWKICKVNESMLLHALSPFSFLGWRYSPMFLYDKR